MTTSEIATVLAWQDALNASDIDTLLSLSSDGIEIGDAKGAAQGHEALRTWAATWTRTEEIGRMYVHHGVVVAELKYGGGASAGASAFRVLEDHVTAVFHHADLAAALAATELNEGDLVS